MAGWSTYAKHRDLFRNNLAICGRDRHVYNSGVPPAMIYCAQTWTLTKQAKWKEVCSTSHQDKLPTSGSGRGQHS